MHRMRNPQTLAYQWFEPHTIDFHSTVVDTPLVDFLCMLCYNVCILLMEVFMEEKDKYLEAAQIVANCKPSKLPYVLTILKQGGIDVSDRAVKAARENLRDRETYRKELRESKGTDLWNDTGDPTCLLLRKIYNDGESIIRLGNVAGVHRSSMYAYIRGITIPSVPVANRILRAVSELYGDKYA